MFLTVKICGLSTRETLDAALDAGADMAGFMFFPASPRNVSLSLAEDLGRRVGKHAQKVAVTVDADDALLDNIVEAMRPDLLQLHGNESVARVRDIKARVRLPVMKVIAVATAADLAGLQGYAAVADRILFDAKAPKDATRPGGLGLSFDWRLLQNIDLKIPFMVSGGLDADNVAAALRIMQAGGVDVSSGVESAPGVKEPDKIRAFIRAARAAHEAVTKEAAGS